MILISLIGVNSFLLKNRLFEGFRLVFRLTLDCICILLFYVDRKCNFPEELRKLGTFGGYFVNVKVLELKAFALFAFEALKAYLDICLGKRDTIELNPEKLLLDIIELLFVEAKCFCIFLITINNINKKTSNHSVGQL